MTYNPTAGLRAALLATLFFIAAQPGHAQAVQNGQEQGYSDKRRIPVTVALVDALPAGSGPFAILRRVDAAVGDVILLPSDADAAALSDAVHTLVLVRREGGDTSARNATIRMRPTTGSSDRRPVELPWAGRVLADVRTASPRTVPGVGTARTVRIWLPPQRGRNAQP
jgi:hypothetical protein